MQFDKRYALLLFAVGLWVWIGYSIVSHTPKHTIKATIIQSKSPLRTIDSKIVPLKKEEVLWIDKLSFPLGNELRYPTYGYLGYRKNFVIYFDSDIVLLHDQNVTFYISSDDGFRLWIDGKKRGEYPKDRAYSRSIVHTFLQKGPHHIRIKYFQGYGQLGIKVMYETKGNGSRFFGEDSKELHFIER